MNRSETPGYDLAFYAALGTLATASAGPILKILFDLMQPASVADIGCGDGSWLAAFQAAGVADIQGVDGGWVASEALKIPQDRFRRVELGQPFALGRTYDLAVSLEVAEHLPSTRADSFVADLTMLAPVVLFSAAIPGQGGTNHINEQWPNYWAARFTERGYHLVDPFRLPLWDEPAVSWWYKQNLVLYASEAGLDRWPKLRALASDVAPSSLVHPEAYARMCKLANPGFGRWARMMPKVLGRSIAKRTGLRCIRLYDKLSVLSKAAVR